MTTTDWHVAVFTATASGMALYMDDETVVSNAVSYGGVRNNADVAFGRLLTNVNGYFTGSLAEVRFYDNALAAGEASTLIDQLTTTHITGATEVPVPGILPLIAMSLPGMLLLARRR